MTTRDLACVCFSYLTSVPDRLRVTETDNPLYLRENDIRKTLNLEGEKSRMRRRGGAKEKALNDSRSTCSSR